MTKLYKYYQIYGKTAKTNNLLVFLHYFCEEEKWIEEKENDLNLSMKNVYNI
jgi:hypothetical protein